MIFNDSIIFCFQGDHNVPTNFLQKNGGEAVISQPNVPADFYVHKNQKNEQLNKIHLENYVQEEIKKFESMVLFLNLVLR